MKKNFTTKHIKWLLLQLFLLGMGNHTFASTIHYVKAGATGSGANWYDASGELQATINAAIVGDEVWVAAGEYLPASGQSFYMNEGVKIYGGFPATGTPVMTDRNWNTYKSILRGNGATVLKNDGNKLTTAALLDGFTITGGNSSIDGAGIRNVRSSPTLKNLVVENNNSSIHSSGIYNESCSPVIRESIIRNNTASYEGSGIAIDNANVTMINLVISGNYTGSYGSAIRCIGGSSSLTNCTVTGNRSGYNLGGCVTINGGGSLAIKNSIIYNNNNLVAYFEDDDSRTLRNITINNSLVQGYPADLSKKQLDGNLNPLFVDAANGDYRLKMESPAKDAGDNSYFQNLGTSDFNGQPRIYGSTIDLGAFENQEALNITRRYVKVGGIGEGYSWENASSELQQMITNSSPGNEVWVAAGQYQPAPDHSFEMAEGVKIYGGFPTTGTPVFSDRNFSTNVTTLKGNGASVVANVFNYLSRAALLDGFTITGGSTTEDGGGIRNWYASPSLYNLKIIGNTARNGAGIDNGHADILLVNSLITGNTATNYGSGFSNYASFNPTLINVTVAGNTGPAGLGAVSNEAAHLAIINSIVYGNTTAKGIANESDATTTVSYSLIEDRAAGAATNNNLNGTLNYPNLFNNATNGDYSINSLSAAVNMGNGAAYPEVFTTSKDLNGNPRVFSGKIDIGAYESQSLPDISVRYVREGYNGNGYSWENASNDLQAMINESKSGNEIWVTAGTYKPNRLPTDLSAITTTNSDNAFLLKDGVKIYGGFDGSETTLDQRNISANESVLNGNLGSDIHTRHIVLAIGTTDSKIGSGTILDGFTITGSKALGGSSITVNGHAIAPNNGAAVYNFNSLAHYSNLKINNNQASNYGGGIYNWASSPTFKNLQLSENSAGSGGAIANYLSDPIVFNAKITGNSAIWGGGIFSYLANGDYSGLQISGNSADFGSGIYNSSASPTVLNATIASNVKHGVYNTDNTSTPSFSNTIIYGNTSGVTGGISTYTNSLVQDLAATGENLDGTIDPGFINALAPALTTGGDYHLSECSPVINAGDNSLLSVSYSNDLSGQNRLYGSFVDLGAYEYQASIQTAADRLAANAAQTFVQIESGKKYYVFASGGTCRNLATIESKGTTPVSGEVSVSTYVTTGIPTGPAYVKRHYDLSPTTNSSSATARLTLYFTQEEFSAFNTPGTPDKLPTKSDDDTGKSNLRVYQYHGTPKNGTGATSYDGSPVMIDPADEDILWNNALERWEVSFDVNGFSGFFIGSTTNPLPVTLISFTGRLTDNQSVELNWKVTEQQNILEYVVEYSTNAREFTEVGRIQASESRNYDYRFEAKHPFSGSKAYYRLRILEANATSLSRIIGVNVPELDKTILYPMPAHDFVWLKSDRISGKEIRLFNTQGQLIRTVTMQADEQRIDLSSLPAGTYLLQLPFGGVKKLVKR